MTGRALVTGAAGFIGSHLVDALLGRKYTVVGLDNLRTGRRENVGSAVGKKDFVLLETDVCDTRLVSRVGESLDLVFHLAAVSSVKMSVKKPQEVNHINVGGTVNALDMARRLDAKRVVLASSAAVYGDPKTLPVDEEAPLNPLSPYAASKVAAEMYCRAFAATHGMEYTILRYFNVYGPRQSFSEYSGVISIFVNNVLKHLPIDVEGDGKQTRSFVYVEDAVRSTILAGESASSAGEIMNVSGTDSVTINDLATLVSRLAGGEDTKIRHVSPRQGDVRESIGKMDRAKALLGFAPSISLSEGIARTIEWFRLHP